MYRKILMIMLSMLIGVINAETEYTNDQRIMGYVIDKNTTYFVFDADVYGVAPARVVVAGSFRNWSKDMDDPLWQLNQVKTEKNLWVLKSKSEIPLGSTFKFRIDDGEWLSPPATAVNVQGGNLTVGNVADVKRIRANIIDNDQIHVEITGKDVRLSLDPDDYQLSDARGVAVPIANIFYLKPGLLWLRPENDIDKTRIYYLRDTLNKLQTVCRFDGWFMTTYSDKQLGAYYDTGLKSTIFRIFAPRASAVTLYLYNSPEEDHYKNYIMTMDKDGVWEAFITENLNGVYYDYTVNGPNEPGNHFFETNPVHISDPYAQVSVDTWGPGRVWPDVEPPRPVKGGIPAMEDVISYEVHIQDFTAELPIDPKLRGTFSGFIQRGLTNSRGQKIGFDHLVELGINVVHLMPIQEYMHYPTDEWQKAFKDDPYMIEQGVNEENYQWGYRTSHAFAIESRFREKGSEWGAQNEQFRDLVEAFHDEGIAVIVDLVFNHSAERMDGRMDYFNFSVLDKQYYYRTDENLDFLGEYGTELKSEHRPMVRRWIIDQCKNLIEQYGVDGFRIDLAGQTDEQTLLELKRELGPEIIVYGEPWIASQDPDYENNPDWDWYKADAPITFFQDDARNAFKGPPSNPKNKWQDRGYAGGNGDRENVKKALSAGFETDDTPIDGINYLDIHDNWALADRFAKENWDGRFGVYENRVKIAATLLFTSLGPVVMHGGTEFLRSKGHAPLVEIVKKFQGGNLHFHGKRDTYNLAKANFFVWADKGKSKGDDQGRIKNNYDNMYQFWRSLIAMRNSEDGKIFRIAKKPAQEYYTWIEPENTRLLGYTVNNEILVLINTDSVAAAFTDIKLPDGSAWRMIGDINQVNHKKGISGNAYATLNGGQNYTINMDPATLYIWLKK